MVDERDSRPDPAILEQLFRDSPLPLAIYGLDGELRHSNDAHDAFARALGDAAGIGLFSALRDLRSERGGHRARFLRAVAGEVLDYAFAVRSPDAPGEDTQHFHRVLMPAYDAQRNSVGVVSAIIDVSEWLHAERDRARLLAELQQAQKAESLGLLAGSIAHDFNNLLVGVLGNVSLLLEALDEHSSLRRIAQAIELAAQRAADVARQLLAYAGKGQFRIEEVNLSELVTESSELLRITLAQRAELSLALSPGSALVKADATQLRQIVMNLILNARDAVSPGGRITVRTGELAASSVDPAAYLGSPDPRATSFVYLEVEDTGHGMDAATAARIFDPFFTTKPSGRGLGLSAVLGIVRGHGGCMGVHSTPGTGTTMRVLLPAHGHAAERLKLLSPRESAPQPAHHGHVLVVDDDAMIRSLLGSMLQKLGYSVTSAATARQALSILEREAASLCCVLLDLTMPEQDGTEAFARIREGHPQLPVVFMSGYEARAVPVANGFLHKPFTLGELRQAMQSVLDG
jgi:signal transduction histidine kinase/CheY-like chemotaxis protein